MILSVVDESDFETLLSWRFTTKTLYECVPVFLVLQSRADKILHVAM